MDYNKANQQISERIYKATGKRYTVTAKEYYGHSVEFNIDSYGSPITVIDTNIDKVDFALSVLEQMTNEDVKYLSIAGYDEDWD